MNRIDIRKEEDFHLIWQQKFVRNILNIEKWYYLLIISALIGPGISYSNVYLFHIAWVIWVALFLMQGPDFIKDIFRKEEYQLFSFIIIPTLLWNLLSVFWVQNKGYLLQNSIILVLGYTTTLAILYHTQQNKKIFENSVKLIFGILLLEMLVSILEIFTDFRWPISRFSEHIHWFHKSNDLKFVIESAAGAEEYISTSPAGFSWNPNDLSFKFTLLFSFVLFSNRHIISVFLTTIILLIVIASGARVEYLTIFLITTLSLLFVTFYQKNLLIIVKHFFLWFLVLCLMTGFFTFDKVHIKKLDELTSISRTLIGLTPFVEQASEHSGSSRKELIVDGILCFKNTCGLGVGSGNFKHHRELKQNNDRYYMVNMHSHLVEILAEGGIVFATIYSVWLGMLLYSAYRLTTSKKIFIDMPSIKYGLLFALIGFIPGSNGPSSCVYFLPMYILWGITLVTIEYSNSYEDL